MSEPSVEEIVRFFQAKGVSGLCPACRHDRWIRLDNPENFVWVLSARGANGDHVIPAPAIPVIALTCENCSFIRLHAAIPVKNWLAENPPPNESPEP